MPRLPGNAIRLYTRDTERGKDLCPTLPNERVPRTQNALWPWRVVSLWGTADSANTITLRQFVVEEVT